MMNDEEEEGKAVVRIFASVVEERKEGVQNRCVRRGRAREGEGDRKSVV